MGKCKTTTTTAKTSFAVVYSGARAGADNFDSGQYLVISEAADVLGVSEHTLRNWVKTGQVRAEAQNGRMKVSGGVLRAVLEDIRNGRLERKKRSRANKTAAETRRIPLEQLSRPGEARMVAAAMEHVWAMGLRADQGVFLLALNHFVRLGLITRNQALRIAEGKSCRIGNSLLKREFDGFLASLPPKNSVVDTRIMLGLPLPEAGDCLGLIYQSLSVDGCRSKGGMFYTPFRVAEAVAEDLAGRGGKVLDPCCGSGAFLLAFARRGVAVNHLYGFDSDPLAVRIARLNFFAAFPELDKLPNIVVRDTLLPAENDSPVPRRGFDVIATNPPWGARYSLALRAALRDRFPEIVSGESFSYFVKAALAMLRRGGLASFILPESVLNVARHRDVRAMLLESAIIGRVEHLDRVFTGVFTPAVRIDFAVGPPAVVEKAGFPGWRPQQVRGPANPGCVFYINAGSEDARIIDKVFSTPHITLAGNADWALGIVTGDNRRLLQPRPGPGLEPVYRGRDVKPFRFGSPGAYIRFNPGEMQQSAPEKFYRSTEKLIYRFVSRRLVFAHDVEGRLTLNSANLVIPRLGRLGPPGIAALFNSTLYQYLFQKLFFSLKVLRSHLESLPLPLWDAKVTIDLAELSWRMAEGGDAMQAIDKLIMDNFGFSAKDRIRIMRETDV